METLLTHFWWTAIIPLVQLALIWARAMEAHKDPKSAYSTWDSTLDDFWNASDRRKFLRYMPVIASVIAFILQFLIVLFVGASNDLPATVMWAWLYPVIPLIVYLFSPVLASTTDKMIKTGKRVTNAVSGSVKQRRSERMQKRTLKGSSLVKKIKRACEEILEILPQTWVAAQDFIRFMRTELLPDLLEERKVVWSTIKRLRKDMKAHANLPGSTGLRDYCTTKEEVVRLEKRFETINNTLKALYQFLDLRAEAMIPRLMRLPDGEQQFLQACKTFCAEHDLPTDYDDSVLAALNEVANVGGSAARSLDPDHKKQLGARATAAKRHA
jgi:hypothetical protein